MKFRSPRLPKQFEGSNLTRPPSRFFFKIDRRREFRPRGPSFGNARLVRNVFEQAIRQIITETE